MKCRYVGCKYMHFTTENNRIREFWAVTNGSYGEVFGWVVSKWVY
jgi:hypothetical protein